MLQYSPTQTLVLGFLAIIFLGASLLSLPIAASSGIGTKFLDALFTSTSAVCVTGLVVVNTLEHWSIFGQLVILVLIQIGALGFMTFLALIFILIGRKTTLRERLVMKEALNQNDMQGIASMIKNIVKLTFIVELIGALILCFVMIPEFGLINGIYKAVFHSISAFCNAGFDIIGNSSLIPYNSSIVVNITIMILIVLGGLGFTVWTDLITSIKSKVVEKYSVRIILKRLSLHTKLVLIMTGVLIVFGTLFIYMYEYDNVQTMKNLSEQDKVISAFFQSITARTAGFNTIPLDTMNTATQIIMIILMFIGGSPSGTAGGIKTVTLGVLILAIMSEIKGKEKVEVFNKTISNGAIKRALTVVVIGLAIVMTATLMLTITEKFSFMEVLFESVSAFATVGLTLGITPGLTAIGKIILITEMFVGRLGPMTIAIALLLRNKNEKNNSINYPEEKIIVG
ncbi:MAG TPA: Trk family potassium uptake protein [Clostridiales bacterium]|nr:MAG: Trk family potassium uptake protein [Clostridiales bacterium GWD2_32_59]HAN09282.1 Trk family potassium uptake protein [Clostridiales bacterium]